MKTFIFSAFLSLLCVGIFAQVPAATLTPLEKKIYSEKEQTGKVVFIRGTGNFLHFHPFNTFIGNKLVSRLGNKRFAEVELQEGSYEYAIQVTGKELKPKTDKINVDVIAGKTKYILLVFIENPFSASLETVEITEQDALRFLSKVKENKNY